MGNKEIENWVNKKVDENALDRRSGLNILEYVEEKAGGEKFYITLKQAMNAITNYKIYELDDTDSPQYIKKMAWQIIVDYINHPETKENDIYFLQVQILKKYGINKGNNETYSIAETLERINALLYNKGFKNLKEDFLGFQDKPLNDIGEKFESQKNARNMALLFFLVLIASLLLSSAILTGSPFTAFSILGSWLK